MLNCLCLRESFVQALETLVEQVKGCRLCASCFEHEPRPVLQVHPKASILIAGQAPGRKVHETGVPFDDASGDRLRLWLGLSKEEFYNPELVAILPMGFCFPGTGKSGDLPPRPECAKAWRSDLMAFLPNLKVKLLVGQYALNWHMKGQVRKNLTETVKAWRDFQADGYFPMPHPSPRNNIWLSKNQWFEAEVVPELQAQVRDCIN
nr:uracil-DNA glycosylase family protein [Kordiimonas laminariae]